MSKLLNIVQPDVALFGQKDAQQVFLVSRMVADLNVPVAVEVVPIVREADGLALSSRNRYLSAEAQRAALALSASLARGSMPPARRRQRWPRPRRCCGAEPRGAAWTTSPSSTRNVPAGRRRPPRTGARARRRYRRHAPGSSTIGRSPSADAVSTSP